MLARAMSALRDTIYSLATPAGKSAIALLRVSGPGSHKALSLCDRPVLSPRRMHLRRLMSEEGVVDQVMLVKYDSPASYTGEDMLEINCHGGLAVTRKLSKLLERLGMRQAHPGEFTRRAIANDKIGLA
jgi:tRNA modification GTPase